MSQITIKLAPSELMGEFYSRKLPTEMIALRNIMLYKDAGAFEVAAVGEAAAEEVFDLTNNPDRQGERELLYGRGRSVSVGDMIAVDDDLFLCAPMGWIKLSYC